MRAFPRFFSLSLLLSLLVIMAACGGGSKSTTSSTATTLIISPTSLSLTPGDVVTLGATFTDANKLSVAGPGTPTFTSSNEALVQVSDVQLIGGANAWLACAGTWDSKKTPVVCTKATTTGTATITATAGSLTTNVPVGVHVHVGSITISPQNPACFSQTQTQQFSAVVKDSSGNDITAQAGTVTWVAPDTTVVTVDANGLATAGRPGATNIFASVGGVNSLPSTFTTCPPQSISIVDTTSSATSASLAPSGTDTLAATVVDTKGNPITDIGLTFTSSNTGVVVATGAGKTGALTAIESGAASVVAGCVPPTCNPNLTAIYSNPFKVTVTGISSNTIYVTGNAATTIVPIPTGTGIPGTAITIPQVSVNGTATNVVVNSLLMSHNGINFFVGTDLALFVFNSAAAAPTTVPAAPGTVMAISPNDIKVAVNDTVNGRVYIYDVNAQSVDRLGVTGATGIAFSADSSKAFIVSGDNLYVYQPGQPLRSIGLTAVANDVTGFAQSSAMYLAGGSSVNAASVRAVCDNSFLGNAGALPSAALKVAADAVSDRVFAVDTTSIDNIAVTVNSSACPPSITNSPSITNLGVGAFTPHQLIVSGDGTLVYVTSNLPQVIGFNAVSNTPSTITLTGAVTGVTTGALTLDGAQLYVGALGTNDVHRINTAAGVDAQQFAVGLKKADGTAASPDFVVMRPQ